MKAQIPLKDVTLYWANLRERNDMSNKYQVDLCNLNDEQVKAFKAAGVTPRSRDDDRGLFVTAKSSNYPIIAYRDSGEEIHDKVANGTIANVVCETYDWSHAPTKRKGTGVGIKIGGLIVTDLKVYNPTNDVSFNDLEDAL